MRYSTFCIFAFLLFTLTGCIEEYEADLPKEDSNLLVVEGTICSGKLNKFYLSRAQAINSTDAPHMVTGARLSVRGSDGSEYMAVDNGQLQRGVYSCQTDVLNPDVEYYLHIETDGEVYESEPQKPLRTEEITEVRGWQDTPESDIDVLVTAEAPFESGKTNYYSWTYDETWEVHPQYITDVYFDIETMKRVFKDDQFPRRGWIDARNTTIIIGTSRNYEGQHMQGVKIYDISRSSERMYHRYSGLIHQRAISKAEYEYELARRQAGSEMGGLFTPLPSFLPSNIRCVTSGTRAIGFVGCSMNTSEYRFFLSPADFAIYRPQQRDTRIWLENCSEADCYEMVKRGMFLCAWEDDRMMMGPLRTAWATAYQLDVRVKYPNAYIEKPEFWKYYTIEDEEADSTFLHAYHVAFHR